MKGGRALYPVTDNALTAAVEAVTWLVGQCRRGGPLHRRNRRAVAQVSRTGKWHLSAIAQLRKVLDESKDDENSGDDNKGSAGAYAPTQSKECVVSPKLSRPNAGGSPIAPYELTLFSFLDAAGVEQALTITDAEVARDHAAQHGLVLLRNSYEFVQASRSPTLPAPGSASPATNAIPACAGTRPSLCHNLHKESLECHTL
jgi:hypothetical protein